MAYIITYFCDLVLLLNMHGCKAKIMNSFSDLSVPECSQAMEFDILGGTIFTEGGYYSLVNIVRGDIIYW